MRRALIVVAVAVALNVQLVVAQAVKVAARPGSVPAGMVRIPAGSFMPLYAPPGQRTVRVESFAIDTVPVSEAQYAAFIAKQTGKPVAKADTRKPATNVTWLEAKAYCSARNARLPTTYEWEYIAQADERQHDAGLTAAFRQRAMQLAISGGSGQLLIGSGVRNVWGVRDLHGLVSEWTADFNESAHGHNSDAHAQGRSAHTPAMTCASGTVETGDPGDYAAFLRYSLRRTWKVNSSSANLGFRCAV